jgi:hypothetical protein
MKNFLFALIALGFLGTACQNPKQENVETTKVETTALPSETPPDSLLRHVVLFKFKEEATPEQITTIVNAFNALKGQIAEIHDFEWGTDVSVENLAQGFTHAFVVTFRSTADRDTYIPHPVHQDFVKLVGPSLDKVLVVDFWTSPSSI